MLVDYAHHLIKMEARLKDIHALCLDRRYAGAAAEVWELVEEAAKLAQTLHAMQREQGGR